MRQLGNGKFGAFVIRSVEEGGQTCINGLPLVSPTVRMLGRFQHLMDLRHETLCQYLELFRCNLARNLIIIVTEWSVKNLHTLLNENILSVENIFQISAQVTEGLNYLHSLNFTHGNLNLKTIQIIDEDNFVKIRLSSFGLPYLTDHEKDAKLSHLFDSYTISPELYCCKENSNIISTQKSDVWSFGIILIQLYWNICFETIWSKAHFSAVLEKCCRLPENVYDVFFESMLKMKKTSGRNIKNSMIETIIKNCIQIRPSQRLNLSKISEMICGSSALTTVQNETSELDSFRENVSKNIEQIEKCYSSTQLLIEDVFFLWKMSGASCENILIRNNVIQLCAPVSTLPNLVLEDFVLFGNESSRNFFFNSDTTILPDSKLYEKLKSIDISTLLQPLSINNSPILNENSNLGSNEKLPANVKEKDVIYQVHRMVLFHHILSSVHHSTINKILYEQSIIDIPPLLRNKIWQALLHLSSSDILDFSQLDTLASHTSDRQLDVDIPRCHQYEDLMTSPAAHASLRRILKSWLLMNENYVYWQGCDSLAAPFLLLNFSRPDIALFCLNKFIHRYLYNFFLRDNSVIIQEYLCVFNHLLAYADAQLYAHLTDLGFFPELYAIPWFLTCFAHVLPMRKLFHIWDQVLLHDSSFPLMIGLAVMKQLRPRLLNSTFNDAILLFSDLPDLPVNKIIEESLKYYEIIPSSCTFRYHASPYEHVHSDERHKFSKNLRQLSVMELKQMDCPRMSFDEFIWRVRYQKIAVIDIRHNIEFSRNCVIRSINYPNIEDDSFKNVANVFTMAQENQHPICIVWGKEFQAAVKFTSNLINRGVNGVCIFDGGFESIRDNQSLIVIPH